MMRAAGCFAWKLFIISSICVATSAFAFPEKDQRLINLSIPKDKIKPTDTATISENNETLKKNLTVAIIIPKTTDDAGPGSQEEEKDSSSNSYKREPEQDIVERAFEFIHNAQEFWINGEIENALDSLDQAYSILLDLNGDADISRQKDDLRLLIAKKILAIYTAKDKKDKLTNGNRSEIPIVMTAEVEKEIRSFQTVERDFFVHAYQRASFFRPTILEALRKAGLPEELSWLPLVESGFKIRALSKARALGLWQFIPSTGFKYGLNRDDWVDERMDVDKSTQAAIGYMKDLHEMFGDWLTVLAAYNCGEGRVLRLISSQHINYLDRFWDLYNLLPNETARYVPRFLATLHIIKDPEKYGFNLDAPSDNQTVYAYKIVKTKKCMTIQDIASNIDVPDDLLSTLNAELRYRKTPDREYAFKVPPEAVERFISAMAEIPEADIPRSAEPRRVALLKHKVKTGETLASIARRYKTTSALILKYNKSLGKSDPKVGYTIAIPVTGSIRLTKTTSTEGREANVKSSTEYITYKIKKGDTFFSLSKRFNVGVAEIRKMNNLKSGEAPKVGQVLKFYKRKDLAERGRQAETKGRNMVAESSKNKENDDRGPQKTYTVKKGDNLYRIALQNGSNIDKILRLNNLGPDKNIHPGQVIVLR